MTEVVINIRFIGSEDKFPSQQLSQLVHWFELLKFQGEKIPAMEITTRDHYGNMYKTKRA